MDFLRLGEKEKIRDIGSGRVSAASLTDGDTGELRLETQEHDLRIAWKTELACSVEGVQNVFICEFDGCGGGVAGLLDSGKSKVGLHGDSYPLRNSSTRAEGEKNGYRAQFNPVSGRMCIHKLFHFEDLLRWRQ
jgi:hypothetical protein